MKRFRLFSLIGICAFLLSACAPAKAEGLDAEEYIKLHSDGLECRIGDFLIVGESGGASLLQVEDGAAKLIGHYEDRDFTDEDFASLDRGASLEQAIKLLGCPRFQVSYGKSLAFGEEEGDVYQVNFDAEGKVESTEVHELLYYWGKADEGNPDLRVEDALRLPSALSMEELYRLIGLPNELTGSGLLFLLYSLEGGGWMWCNSDQPDFADRPGNLAVLVQTGKFVPEGKGLTKDNFSIDGASFSESGDSVRVKLGEEEATFPKAEFSVEAFQSVEAGQGLLSLVEALGMPSFGGSDPLCIQYCHERYVYTVELDEGMKAKRTYSSLYSRAYEYAFDHQGRKELRLSDLLSTSDLTSLFRVFGKPYWICGTFAAYVVESGAMVSINYPLGDAEVDFMPSVVLAASI